MHTPANLAKASRNRTPVSEAANRVEVGRKTHPDISSDDSARVGDVKVCWNWWRISQSQYRYRDAGEIDLGEIE